MPIANMNHNCSLANSPVGERCREGSHLDEVSATNHHAAMGATVLGVGFPVRCLCTPGVLHMLEACVTLGDGARVA